MFRRRRPPALALPAVPAAATFIEAGSALSGQLHFPDSVRVDGSVEGEIRAGGTVVVGEGAVVEASILADTVVVLGQVEGEIAARRQVTVYKSASVHGDIHTAGIVVEPGANLRGCIVIGEESSPALTVVGGSGAAQPLLDAGD